MAMIPELRSVPVVAIGDSMVAGLGDGEGTGWPGRLVRRAAAEGLDLHSSNLGIRGDTGPMVAARWEEVDRRLRAWPGSLVIAGFGLNDVMVRRGPDDAASAAGSTDDPTTGAPATIDRTTGDCVVGGSGERSSEVETLTALRWMAGRVPQSRFAVIGPPATEWPEVNERARTRSARMGEACRELGVLFVPTFDALLADAAWSCSLAAGDGAHPDAAGWDRFADVVVPPLIDWIRRREEPR